MADFPTFQDFFRAGRDEILSRNSRLTLEAIEREGSDANVIVAGSAAMADEVGGQLLAAATGLYLDSAKSKALDRFVYDRFTLLRKPAAPARGDFAFSTIAANPLAFTIPAGTKAVTQDGKAYVTDVDVTYPFGSVGPVSVSMRSQDAGSAFQAKAGSITNLASQIVNAPSDLTVTNPLATVGAADAELDSELVTRAREFFPNARRGTIGAIQNQALEVPGVQTATAFEFLDEFGRPAKVVQLVISDPFTLSLVAASPTPVAYQAQSQTLATTVFDSLYDTRAAGINVLVTVASVQMLGIQLGLAFLAGYSASEVTARAQAALVNYVNSLSPGQVFSYEAAINRLRMVQGLDVQGNEILSPLGDTTPLPLQVLRTSQALVVASQS